MLPHPAAPGRGAGGLDPKLGPPGRSAEVRPKLVLVSAARHLPAKVAAAKSCPNLVGLAGPRKHVPEVTPAKLVPKLVAEQGARSARGRVLPAPRANHARAPQRVAVHRRAVVGPKELSDAAGAANKPNDAARGGLGGQHGDCVRGHKQAL